MTIQHGYTAKRISGKWIYSPATKDEDGDSTCNGRFCQSPEEAETFCKEINEGLWL